MDKAIGGYIELETFHGEILHKDAVRVNTARNALRLLIRKRGIRKILLPRFICDSVIDGCEVENAEVDFYEVGYDFKPVALNPDRSQWVYLVNYYGQLDDGYIRDAKQRFGQIILDDVQAYFHSMDDSVDVIYSCRKFFGLPDGGLLQAKGIDAEDYPLDVSYQRMRFLLGRYEVDAQSFYPEYVENNELMGSEPIKRMSRLTENLLRGIEYDAIRKTRKENYQRLHESLGDKNLLRLKTPDGPFAYPMMMENGAEIRKKLIANQIFVPLLWPNVVKDRREGSLAAYMAENILPLPCDQRYNESDMDRIVNTIRQYS